MALLSLLEGCTGVTIVLLGLLMVLLEVNEGLQFLREMLRSVLVGLSAVLEALQSVCM